MSVAPPSPAGGSLPLDDRQAIYDELAAWLIEHLDARADRIGPDARLFHDLGMDGDDAVEFFHWFGERYGVDLAPLYSRWSDHFGPEGFGSPWLLLIPAWALLLFATVKLDLWIWLPVLSALAVLLILLWRAFRALRAPKPLPITLRTLADAARTGAWSACRGWECS